MVSAVFTAISIYYFGFNNKLSIIMICFNSSLFLLILCYIIARVLYHQYHSESIFGISKLNMNKAALHKPKCFNDLIVYPKVVLIIFNYIFFIVLIFSLLATSLIFIYIATKSLG